MWNARSKRPMVPASSNFICHFFTRAVQQYRRDQLLDYIYVLRLYSVYIYMLKVFYIMWLVKDLH